MSDRLLTTAEVAARLGVSCANVRKAATTRRLDRVEGGRRGSLPCLFTERAVAAYERDHMHGRTARCRTCGASFVAVRGYEAHCTPRCRDKANARRKLGIPSGGHPARPCDHCGEPFPPVRRDQHYCSTTCRVKAFFARHGINPSRYTYHREGRVTEARRAASAAGLGNKWE